MIIYKPLIWSSVISLSLSILLLVISYIFALQKEEEAKIIPYECGFEPFENARQTFEVRFVLVGIIFLIFDLEVSFLFPWCVTIINTGIFSYWVMIYFLFILIGGLCYEWWEGGLEWN